MKKLKASPTVQKTNMLSFSSPHLRAGNLCNIFPDDYVLQPFDHVTQVLQAGFVGACVPSVSDLSSTLPKSSLHHAARELTPGAD